ncbi:2-phospho-L-lactate guanylyltransferase [Anaerolineales bacterium HSG6]|nr:2-phospho-L-lactate guanylyltransferase [Anaerolineales bacterium HSG6]MDM8529532.1 2-phospho-L-lactate guanylyltransferase [Anaerolineales bacterium HSG25]
MTDLCILIPAKPFQEAKTRLSPVLSPQQRVLLSRYLLKRTIHIAQQVSEVVVISRSQAVRQLAKQAGAWSLVEFGTDLNRALQQGLRWIEAQGGQSVLILPADLPHLQTEPLWQIIALGKTIPALVVAPCQRGEGTNALFLRPLGLIEPQFGLNSFTRHQQAAHHAGIEPIIINHPALAFDIDIPIDLEQARYVMREIELKLCQANNPSILLQS